MISSEMREIRDALQTIVNNSHKKALNWAVEYARFGVELIGDRCDNETLRVQLMYVAENITRWRGEEAARVRKVIKDAIKNLKS